MSEKWGIKNIQVLGLGIEDIYVIYLCWNKDLSGRNCIGTMLFRHRPRSTHDTFLKFICKNDGVRLEVSWWFVIRETTLSLTENVEC